MSNTNISITNTHANLIQTTIPKAINTYNQSNRNLQWKWTGSFSGRISSFCWLHLHKTLIQMSNVKKTWTEIWTNAVWSWNNRQDTVSGYFCLYNVLFPGTLNGVSLLSTGQQDPMTSALHIIRGMWYNFDPTHDWDL